MWPVTITVLLSQCVETRKKPTHCPVPASRGPGKLNQADNASLPSASYQESREAEPGRWHGYCTKPNQILLDSSRTTGSCPTVPGNILAQYWHSSRAGLLYPGSMLSQDLRHSMHCYRSSGANVMPKQEETGGAYSGHYGAEERCFAFLCVVIWRFAMCSSNLTLLKVRTNARMLMCWTLLVHTCVHRLLHIPSWMFHSQ